MKIYVFCFILLCLHEASASLDNSLPNNDVMKQKRNIISIPLKEKVIEAGPASLFLQMKWGNGRKFLRASQNFLVPVERTTTITPTLHPIVLANYRNTQFTGEISFGNPEDKFEVIFDTGSANLWINSVLCNDPGCLKRRQYNHFNSPTFRELGLDLTVQFGTGELSGVINTDTIFMAGVEIEEQDFAEIHKELGEVFLESKFDGIVGLAYPAMSAYGFLPIFDNIMMQDKLDQNVFSFYFDKTAGSVTSKLILGGVDETLITGPVKYFPVVDKYYWTIEASNVMLNDNDLGLCPEGCKLVADTGTSLLTGPAAIVEVLLEWIDLKEDCSNYDELPDISFVLPHGRNEGDYVSNGEEIKLTLTPKEYVVKAFNFIAFKEQCAVSIMPLDVPRPHGPLWILGDVFLSKYYSVYDRDHDMVGFAVAKKSAVI
jgi:cathepsin D